MWCYKKDHHGPYGWKGMAVALCPCTSMTPSCPSVLVTVAILEWESPSLASAPCSPMPPGASRSPVPPTQKALIVFACRGLRTTSVIPEHRRYKQRDKETG